MKLILLYYYKIRCRLIRRHIYKTGVEEYYSRRQPYGNGYVLPADETSSELRHLIETEKPFFAGRFGAAEMNAMEVFDFKTEKKFEKTASQMCCGAGFFPKDYRELTKFSELMISSTSALDYLAVWNLSMEEYYIKKYAPDDIVMSRLRYFEPWYSEKPWTAALRGKKVLVIHPFTDTIRCQYDKRELLFENQDILPEFTLLTQRAVQTIAGTKDERFHTWFEALDYMYEEALQQEFEIALIGCGAYGFPLSAKLKGAGKQAIHMGGVLQVLFGIKGGRWDSDPMVSSLYNENWTRPMEHERPLSFKNVENGCYW